MDTKVCRTCEEEKLLTEYYQRSDRDARYNQCKDCRSKRKSKRAREYKKKLVSYLGGECERCGYDNCYSALEFHHKDPSEKSFGINRLASRGLEDLKSEAEKCKLLCANCHREIECGMDSCSHQ